MSAFVSLFTYFVKSMQGLDSFYFCLPWLLFLIVYVFADEDPSSVKITGLATYNFKL